MLPRGIGEAGGIRGLNELPRGIKGPNGLPRGIRGPNELPRGIKGPNELPKGIRGPNELPRGIRGVNVLATWRVVPGGEEIGARVSLPSCSESEMPSNSGATARVKSLLSSEHSTVMLLRSSDWHGGRSQPKTRSTSSQKRLAKVQERGNELMHNVKPTAQ